MSPPDRFLVPLSRAELDLLIHALNRSHIIERYTGEADDWTALLDKLEQKIRRTDEQHKPTARRVRGADHIDMPDDDELTAFYESQPLDNQGNPIGF